MMKTSEIALIGNPNSGKSTLFNALTGSNQKIGNWPGVTVDRHEGTLRMDHQAIRMIDLPGLYSLVTTEREGAIDARIASQYLFEDTPQLLINVIDATHLERHLYLTLQCLALQIPMIIVLNKMDSAKKEGIEIEVEQLEKALHAPVIPISATHHMGLDTLKHCIVNTLSKPHSKANIQYPSEIVESHQALVEQLKQRINPEHKHIESMAWQLLEGDVVALDSLREHAEPIQAFIHETEKMQEDEWDILIADARYQFAHCLVKKTVKQTGSSSNWTQRLDAILLNRKLCIPIFLLVMYSLFVFSNHICAVFQPFFEIIGEALFVKGLSQLLLSWNWPTHWVALLANGVGLGITTTLTFIPIIMGMFLFSAFLESSGYMARVAFVMDRFMRLMGLPGQAFIPLIIGFGCNVPAILATRTLSNPRDRAITVLLTPFMACTARLAIFAVFVSVFFPKGGHNILFLLYLFGIAVALATGWLLRKTLFTAEPTPLILELPTYRLPAVGLLFRQAGYRVKLFLVRAGKIIVPTCALIGFLNTIGTDGQLLTEASSHRSLLAAIGQWLTPLFSPMGITQENWPATVGLLTGTLAKEVVMGTLTTLYGQLSQTIVVTQPFNLLDEFKAALYSIVENSHVLSGLFLDPIESLTENIVNNSNVLTKMSHYFNGQVSAVAYLIFVLLYIPCVSTMAVIAKELNRGWMLFSVLWGTFVAYSGAVLFYQSATLLSHPTRSLFWIIATILVMASVLHLFRWYGKGLQQHA